jgi:hypothetical protein
MTARDAVSIYEQVFGIQRSLRVIGEASAVVGLSLKQAEHVEEPSCEAEERRYAD